MGAPIQAGAVVAYWDGNALALGLVAGEEKRRVRLFLARGQEVRVTASRIAFEVERGAGPPADGPAAGEDADERIGRIAEAAGEAAAGFDVPLIWEIVRSEEGDDAPPRTLEELAQLGLDDGSGPARLAAGWALLADGVHFSRKGDEWLPRAERAVRDLLLQRERVAAREREREEVLAAFRRAAAGDGWDGPGGELERKLVAALERLATEEEAADESVRETALQALRASGLRWDRPHEAAFRLLRAMGKFSSDDENLQIRRFNLRTEFPPEVVEQAEQAARRGPAEAERVDLTALEVFSIDGVGTREIDDALSFEALDGGSVRLGVHVADPAAFVEVGDALDREAQARALTHYFPGRKLTMLPAELSERAASLNPDERRPALSFLAELDAEGRILHQDVCRSWVCSRARLDYGRADEAIRSGTGTVAASLALMDRTARAREELRIAGGAVPIHGPEVDVHVGPGGEITLERIGAGSASRRGVTEAMVLAGAIAARYCIDQKLPIIFRRQDPPSSPIEVPPGGIREPSAARAARRSLRRGETSVHPGRHASLGLEAYVQVTSPLRRFQDLVAHRQVVARLAGTPAPYDATEIQRVAAITERAEAEARLAERSREEYWLLRYLQERTGEELDAIVVDVDPRPVVQLVETLREQPLPSLRGVRPGDRVRVRVERVTPRAALLHLRAVLGSELR